MAESKGWAQALRRVMRGGAVSTSSPGSGFSNMRDCAATMQKNLTQRTRRSQRKGRRKMRPYETRLYFFAAVDLAAASAYFFWKRSTRPAVSTSFCLPVKKGWQFEQISTRSISPLMVERVWKVLPQAQWTVTGW